MLTITVGMKQIFEDCLDKSTWKKTLNLIFVQRPSSSLRLCVGKCDVVSSELIFETVSKSRRV